MKQEFVQHHYFNLLVNSLVLSRSKRERHHELLVRQTLCLPHKNKKNITDGEVTGPPDDTEASMAFNPVYVIMEYMEKGDLKNYLRQLRPDVRISTFLLYLQINMIIISAL